MKIKKVLLIFLLGITVGISVSPFASKLPQDVLISPVEFSLAQRQDLLLPASEEEVLGVCQNQNKKSPAPHFADLLSTKANPIEKESSPASISLYNDTITIAVFGDSMVDTLGTQLPYFKSSLQNYFPRAKFRLFNYGLGAQNIEEAIKRLDQTYKQGERNYPPLPELNADIIVVNSFAYNPFGETEDPLYQHWANLVILTSILEEKTNAKIIVLADIAPSPSQVLENTPTINQYLQNTIEFSQAYHLPLANVYEKSLTTNGQGDLKYIDNHDHIHPSSSGQRLTGQVLAQTIYQLNLFK